MKQLTITENQMANREYHEYWNSATKANFKIATKFAEDWVMFRASAPTVELPPAYNRKAQLFLPLMCNDVIQIMPTITYHLYSFVLNLLKTGCYLTQCIYRRAPASQ